MQKILIFTISISIIALLVGTGCKSKAIPPPRQFVNVPVYVAAQNIPADDQGKIRSSSVMRAYALGRYVDPNRRKVMHEQHTVYREEESPRWNLIPQPDADPILMAQKQQQERYADALAGQITHAANDMRETRNMVRKVLETQASREAKSGELVKLIDDLKKRYGVVSNNLIRASEYINKLEGELKKVQKETELLKLRLRRKGK
ncbi:MAG: hypothetical protein PHV82_18480 [Victivallaceae bacterium]|nr:hypothetical protein [Victivallaceae bacterium]